jgi:hypothetical protein
MGALFSVICGSEKHLPPICDGASRACVALGGRRVSVRHLTFRCLPAASAEDLATPGPLRNAFQLFKSGRPVRVRLLHAQPVAVR